MLLPRVLITAISLQAGFFAHAENWPQWRGSFFNGSSTETNLPASWSKSDHVAWAAPLPGASGATPVIWGESVFVSSPYPQGNLCLICVHRANGQVRWQKVASKGNHDIGRNNMASPSPVTDGKVVVVLFATGDLAAFDYTGRELWKRNLAETYGRFANMWIYASSPMLFKGRLYVQVLQRNPVPGDYSHAQDGKAARESFLLCLNPESGKELWRQVRPTDAREESQEAYSTPFPFQGTTPPQILVVGGDYVTAHNLETGAEVWRCGGLNRGAQNHWRIVPSPVALGDLVFVCAPKRDPVLAISSSGTGLVTETNIVWKFSEFPSDCVTPLVYRNKLFVLDGDRQMLTCLEPQTGAKTWQGNLGVREIFRASPTGADGRIYCVSESGTVVVLAADEFKILATIPFGEAPVRSSIAVAHGSLFIRTAKNLYCIAGDATPK